MEATSSERTFKIPVYGTISLKDGSVKVYGYMGTKEEFVKFFQPWVDVCRRIKKMQQEEAERNARAVVD